MKSLSRMQRLSVMMVLTLLIQFLVGMANNFWLKLPDSGSAWKVAKPVWLVSLHMFVGTALLVLAILIAYRALKSKSSYWLKVSYVGIGGIIVAFGAGSAFMGNPKSNAASFIKALGWAISTGAYALALTETK